MDYFSLLNLQQEPFSTSPDPDFFYASRQHMECLQRLELTIRLRQGLSVVIGDVGTGKTTLCRQLIRRLDEDSDTLAVHLILDPDFSSPQEFLSALIKTFDIPLPATQLSERDFKEIIKDFLFTQAAESGRYIVLIIDEGQKLPGFCLEILRELLNFETNQHKLLQIVIFAQEELDAALLERPNFTDRISCLYRLTPFGFNDSRKMIQYRLQRAGGPDSQSAHLFSLPAILVIHHLSGGYPRKIVKLCSKSILALIIQNKQQVSGALARSCASRLPRQGGTGSSFVRWAIPMLFIACIGWFLLGTPWVKELQQTSNAPMVEEIVTPNEPVIAPLTESPSREPQVVQNTPPEYTLQQPSILGSLPIEQGENLKNMILRIYGTFSQELLSRVLETNPKISNPNLVLAGSTILLPGWYTSDISNNPAGYLVEVGRYDSLMEANSFLKTWPRESPSFRALPVQDPESTPGFLIVTRQLFHSEIAALNHLHSLPEDHQSSASVVAVASLLSHPAAL